MWALMLGIVAVAISFTLGWWLRGTDSERALEDASERYGKQAGQLFDALDQRNAAYEQCELLTKQRNSLIHNVEMLRAERAELVDESDHLRGERAELIAGTWKAQPRVAGGKFGTVEQSVKQSVEHSGTKQ